MTMLRVAARRQGRRVIGCFQSWWQARYQASQSEREAVHYDVCIVGAGPAGLSAAIRTKQIAQEKERDVNVCVLDKGAEIGAHVLSGCVMDPRALNELMPDWRGDVEGKPWITAATKDRLCFLTEQYNVRLPVMPQLSNKGCYVLSLSALCRWMASKAEELGVDIFPGFAAAHVLHNSDGSVGGVQIRDRGVDKEGRPKSNFEPGIEVKAKVTLLAEGCRGSVSQVIYRWSFPFDPSTGQVPQDVMKQYRLREDAEHQTYGLGIKEVPASQHSEGTVLHTIGYPLSASCYGGGFLYHMPENKVAVGLVVGLDYADPHLSIFHEFQKLKKHKIVSSVLKGGTCLQYGARTLNEGGIQCIPQLHFPGGALIGCSAGFMNSLRLKGTHGAMKSGMLAAQALMTELGQESTTGMVVSMADYPRLFRNSWLYDELTSVRNVRPLFRHGLYVGLCSAFLHGTLLRGQEPWTFKFRQEDHEHLRPAKNMQPILYEKPDKELTFDVTASLFNSGTNHDHDQPVHLRVHNPHVVDLMNRAVFDKPETRYCPASVYEYVEDEEGNEKLQINSQNCLHCKACDIKDPMNNIQWTVPEGGGGPNYTLM